LPDKRVRYISRELGLRAVAATTTEAIADAHQAHETTPTATAALGRTITGAALLGATLKDGQTVTLRILGDGPAGTLIGICDARGNVRGYIANPAADANPTVHKKLDVARLVGNNGSLSVSYDLGLKEPYVGTSELVNGEIATDIAYYLTTSEQIASAVGIGVLVGTRGRVRAAGGFLLQVLPAPELDEEGMREREAAIDVMIQRSEDMDSVSHHVAEGADADALMHILVGDLPFHRLGGDALRFQCTCSEARVAKILAAMEEDELRKIFSETDPAEVTCEFCRQRYSLGSETVQALRRNTDDGEDENADDDHQRR